MDDFKLSQQSAEKLNVSQGGPHFDPQLMAQHQKVPEAETKTGYFLKRPLDLLFSSLALVILSPLFLLIAGLIKLTSPGPVFFRQKRLGVNEKPFMILKFRSMRSGSEKTGSQFTKANDSRITAVGKLIRKTSLDELPQLINIFRGEMSLIGPRPYIGFELKDASTANRVIRSSVRPGISGLAQVSGRSALSQKEVITFDLNYVEQCSLGLDFKIVCQTLQKVISCDGSN
ncbi:sugar transferase [Gimesia algae]|uniref:UDP-N-acetylgalactosamine-undecaprenyl-phosphate N-acetylgalactosaminephosphotransferase n=1 Tax=Gimesia algae TaxID=2527971 RepID=A0A517VAT6_9PLAN|nr:sugar transferase [Gimesia algae]QDT90112.1 UDP-N-acetylgalactosamine-undecaprenyl-phosphate N-acetylgalactosaminephosphotransferase [Gimesia algae]